MSKRKTTEEFINEVFNLVGNEYEVLEEYSNNKTKVLFRHNKCKYEFKMSPHNFITNNCRCPKCSGRYKRNHNDFINEVFNLVGNEYEVLSKYKTDGTKKPDKITFLHKKCGNKFEMRAHDFLLNNHRCPICGKISSSNSRKLNNEEFIKKVNSLTKNEYEVLEKYTSCRNKITFLHKKCSNKFKMEPRHFLYDNQRCPNCSKSKGEEKIEKFLIENNILYETQYSFPDCKYKQKLRFDFKLQDSSGKIILIEYDGIQHFCNTFYNNLKIQEKRDEIKNNYCRERGDIDLYRISFKDYDNINTILKSIINRYE